MTMIIQNSYSSYIQNHSPDRYDKWNFHVLGPEWATITMGYLV